MDEPRPPRLARHALGAMLACILLNLLVRGLLKVGGVSATLLVAMLVAVGMAAAFRWQHGRRPYPLERRLLVGLYALGLGLLYAGLLLMMHLKEAPGVPGLVLFGAHYAAYPLLAWLILRPQTDDGRP